MSNVVSTVSRLFRLTLNGGDEDSHSASNELATRLLLAGPTSCGKTSLLFEYAVSCAEQEETVLFIAPKPISRLPLFVNGRIRPKTGTLKLINFVYLPTYAEFIDFFSRVHLSKNSWSSCGRPKHVVIDDFDSYFQEKCSRTEETTRIAKCLAYIIDGINYFSEIQSCNEVKTKCHLLVAEAASGNSLAIEKQGLYKHWISDFVRISTTGQHPFELKHIGCRTGANIHSDLSVYYQINEKGIELIEEDESLI